MANSLVDAGPAALNLLRHILPTEPSKASTRPSCMKYLRLALMVFATGLGLARAEEDEQNRPPPTEIPDFSNLDEYVYEPKSTLIISQRLLSGVKTHFFGSGTIAAPETLQDTTSLNVVRTYHDGSVSPDGRTAGRVDGSGNPVIDPSSGSQVLDPVAPDGQTNTWSYVDSRQALPGGLIAFHDYSAQVNDPAMRNADSSSSFGVEVAVARDMGKLFGTRATWTLMAGFSMNGINAKLNTNVQATLTTITDLYSLNGQVTPVAPYTAPSSTTTTVVDSSGSPVLNTDGTTNTATSDTSTLLSSLPVNHSVTNAINSTSVSNRWDLKGAYYTFRAGPSVSVPLWTRLHASLSAGPAVIYAGSTYSVIQTYVPEIGGQITTTDTSDTSRVLAGYFADASLQFDVTERTGFFAGAVFQNAGSYTQNVDSVSAHYSTKVDFSNQNGLRAGMTVRF